MQLRLIILTPSGVTKRVLLSRFYRSPLHHDVLAHPCAELSGPKVFRRFLNEDKSCDSKTSNSAIIVQKTIERISFRNIIADFNSLDSWYTKVFAKCLFEYFIKMLFSHKF